MRPVNDIAAEADTADLPATLGVGQDADQRAPGLATPARRRAGWLVPLVVPPLVYLAGSVYVYIRVLTDPLHRVIGRADTELFAWYFEWYRHALISGQNPFVSQAINVPGGVNLMWNNGMPPLAIACMPFVAIFGGLATVSVVTALSPALSATSAYFVLRHLSGRSTGAAIGALLFGFGPYFVGHAGHLPLIFLPLVPLILLVGYELLVRQQKPPVRTGVLLGVLLAVQLLLEEEVLAMVAVTATVALLVAAVFYWTDVRTRTRHAAIGLGVAGGVGLVIVAVPLYYQFFGAYAPTKGFAYGAAKADVASLVRPSLLLQYSTLASRRANLAFPANGAENTGYLGWPLIIGALAVCAWLIVRNRPFARWWLLTTVVIVVFSFGTPIVVNGHRVWHGPWAIAHRLPLLGGLLPVRFSVITLLLFACLIAYALASLHGRALAVGIVVVCACLIPLRPAAPYRAGAVPPTPRFFTTSSATDQIARGTNALVMPVPGFPKIDAMLWQAEAGMRFNVVGGYSLFAAPGSSRGWTYFPNQPMFARALTNIGLHQGIMTPAEAAALRPSLLSSKVQYIVITKEQPGHAAVATAAAELTGCLPRQVEDVVLCAFPGRAGSP